MNRKLACRIFAGILISISAQAETHWCAIQIRGEGRECITSHEAEREIEARALDDRTLEYLGAVSRSPEEYASLKKRVLERAWRPGLEAITSDRVWESVGKKNGMSVSRREFNLQLRKCMDLDPGVEEIRKILDGEIGSDLSDAQVFEFRKKQHESRVLTHIRAAFASAVRNHVLQKRASRIVSPRQIQEIYQTRVASNVESREWQGFASNWLTENEAAPLLKDLHSLLSRAGHKESFGGATRWVLQGDSLSGNPALRKLPASELPKELPPIDSTDTRPFAVLAATQSNDVPSRIRVELWVSTRAPALTWEQSAPQIEKELLDAENRRILTKEFENAFELTYPVIFPSPDFVIETVELKKSLLKF